jgi:hypothetical protein
VFRQLCPKSIDSHFLYEGWDATSFHRSILLNFDSSQDILSARVGYYREKAPYHVDVFANSWGKGAAVVHTEHQGRANLISLIHRKNKFMVSPYLMTVVNIERKGACGQPLNVLVKISVAL